MIILFLSNFSEVGNPAAWLYAAAVEFLIFDSIGITLIIREVMKLMK